MHSFFLRRVFKTALQHTQFGRNFHAFLRHRLQPRLIVVLRRMCGVCSVALTVLALPAAGHATMPEILQPVGAVIDGDTFKLADGRSVRLVGLNAPEVASPYHAAEPFGREAANIMQTLLGKNRVRVDASTIQTDRYNRLLADVYLPDGRWLNGELVAAGAAHVYTFADSATADGGARAGKLIALENQARAAKRGLWALKDWQPLDAHSAFAPQDIGRYRVVEGTVANVATVRGDIYLNFGADWRRDFTVLIPKDAQESWAKQGLNPAQMYAKARLRVRGVTKPVNGVLVVVEHPAQLEMVD